MKHRRIALAVVLALLLACVAGAAMAENFTDTPATSVLLGVGETWKLDTSTILAPEGKTLAFKTSDKRIAVVSDQGEITALKKGKATIGIGYDQTLLAVCRVSVAPAPKKVSLSESSVILSVGDSAQLTATLSKQTASALSFTTSNAAVATEDDTGKVTPVGAGKATVTVTTFNDKTAECSVYVLGGKAPTTLSLNVADLHIQVGETFKLAPSVDEGSDAFYQYASRNRKIATVSADGVITGVKKGVTTIGVKTHNGLTQTVTVTVKAKLREIYDGLTNDPATFVKNAKRMKLTRDNAAPGGSVVCRGEELTYSMAAGSCQIALKPLANPKYCVQGIDTSMTPEAASAKLIANGWAMTGSKVSDGVEQRAFTKDGDTTHFIAIATADGLTIQGIIAQWNW